MILNWYSGLLSSVVVCLVVVLFVCVCSGSEAVAARWTRPRAQSNLPLCEVKEVPDKVVKDVLVLHALVEHLQGLKAWGVLTNSSRQVAQLFILWR